MVLDQWQRKTEQSSHASVTLIGIIIQSIYAKLKIKSYIVESVLLSYTTVEGRIVKYISESARLYSYSQ